MTEKTEPETKKDKNKLSNVWKTVTRHEEMMKQFAVNDSVDLSDMTKQKSVPESCVVDGIPNGWISFPELAPHTLEDLLEYLEYV